MVAVALVTALLAVAYYFGVALPAQSRARIQLEREKFEQEQKEKQEAAQEKLARTIDRGKAETDYRGCLADAEANFNRGLKLNGTPIEGKDGSYDLPREMLKNLQSQQNQENEACRREYELALKAIEAK